MNNRELLKSILEIPTETSTVEFKRIAGSKIVSKIIESIVAMANSEGGIFVLGVDDPEKTKLKGLDRIFGIEENLENFDALGREVQRIVSPMPGIWPPEMIEIKEVNKKIALIFVPKATDNFHCVDNRVFIRQEKGNKMLTPAEIITYAYAKGFKKADIEPVKIDFELLDTKYYKEWKEARGIEGGDIKEVLEKTGLAIYDKAGNIFPARAAVMLFAEYPSDLLDTKCAIRVFQYSGTTETIKEVPNLIGLPKTIQGPIVKQIKDAHEYALILLRSGIKIPSGFTAKYQIPERAIKEAITNAVIHRDYYFKRDIEVKIFEDRIEIESPGLFPYNITRYNIGKERSIGFRNSLLVKHLREFPSPPNLDQNEGIRAMRGEMKAQNLYPPIFWTYPRLQNSVRVILLNEKQPSEWEKVSFYLSKNKYINNREARNITGVIQMHTMSRLLRRWVEQGVLEKISPQGGSTKEIRYRLPESGDINKNR